MILLVADFFLIYCFKKFFQDTIRESKGLDSDQDQHLAVKIWVQSVCEYNQQTTKSACLYTVFGQVCWIKLHGEERGSKSIQHSRIKINF